MKKLLIVGALTIGALTAGPVDSARGGLMSAAPIQRDAPVDSARGGIMGRIGFWLISLFAPVDSARGG